MSSFRDSTGYEWSPALTVASLPALRELCRVPAGEPMTTDKVLGGLYAGGPAELTEFVWGLCRKQAADAGVTAADFCGRLDAAALDRLFEAVEADVVGFFTRSEAGATLRKNLPRIRRQVARTLQAAIDRDLATQGETSSERAGNSPASPG